MARGEAQALGWNEVDERVVQRRHHVVYGGDDLLVLMRTGDGQHVRVLGTDARLLHPETARHDDATVLRNRLADGRKALGLG